MKGILRQVLSQTIDCFRRSYIKQQGISYPQQVKYEASKLDIYIVGNFLKINPFCSIGIPLIIDLVF